MSDIYSVEEFYMDEKNFKAELEALFRQDIRAIELLAAKLWKNASKTSGKTVNEVKYISRLMMKAADMLKRLKG